MRDQLAGRVPKIGTLMVSRVAEWALGDEVNVVAGAADVDFVVAPRPVTAGEGLATFAETRHLH